MKQRGSSVVASRGGGAAITRRLERLPTSAWHKAHLDVPKRLHKDIRYVDETITVEGYDGTLRQVAVTGLGRERYSLFLSNNFEVTPRDLVLRYTRRNGIEDGLGISGHFFH